MNPEEVGSSKPSRRNRRLTELVFRLATEGRDPGAQAVAVGIGVFIGCLPVYGLHLILVLGVATLLGLSRVRMFAATWISNPLFAPILVWMELQVGHLMLHGRFAAHTILELKGLGVEGLSWLLAVGSVAVGGGLGLLAAAVVLAVLPRGSCATRQRLIVEGAARRYLEVGLRLWLRARSELYAHRLVIDYLSKEGMEGHRTIIEPDCESGPMLAAVFEAGAAEACSVVAGSTGSLEEAALARRILGDSVSIIVSNGAGFRAEAADLVIVCRKDKRWRLGLDQAEVRAVGGIVKAGGLLVISTVRGLIGVSAKGQALRQLLEAEGFHKVKELRERRWFRQCEFVVGRRR